ncbi:hypothetical protein [Amycolatopsis lexingtonensis]|uniref:hypothetical protein n=1 Tax=Amycolatopsis lexingtonensis TaxID=218822 RepID=UPI003F7060DC
MITASTTFGIGRPAALDHLDADDDGFPVKLAFDDHVDLTLDAEHAVGEELGFRDRLPFRRAHARMSWATE